MAAGISPTVGVLDGECRAGTSTSKSISNGSTLSVDDAGVVASPDQEEVVSNPGSSTPSLVDEKITEALVEEFLPFIRSGGWADIGLRNHMEDAHVRIDDLVKHLGELVIGESTGSFYGVFDGHLGKDAAQFVRENLLKFIVEDTAFPAALEEAVKRAFLRTDRAFAQACQIDSELASGTTALTVLIFGRTLLVANVGDCRAVLCRRGRAVPMSRDHKPSCVEEKSRIESLGGFVDDGYLNGQLSVARALGDWHLEGLKADDDDGGSSSGPLSGEPEMRQAELTEDDEFLIIGCDGLWDAFSSQDAVTFARRRLQQHNDPEKCSKDLIVEALKRDTSDNLTVVTVCFRRDPPPSLRIIKPPVRTISNEGLRNLQELLNSL
ncbi:probable protein phosphatase 2C 57 [Selaginella moellendorffii]|nr:probable protein phosphatase 2C 57 [Selaginella moellendorffii]|eukprot:XP_002982174.2 probable protein phosphatase 2C 57 [Selaginella moellendorffii]